MSTTNTMHSDESESLQSKNLEETKNVYGTNSINSNENKKSLFKRNFSFHIPRKTKPKDMLTKKPMNEPIKRIFPPRQSLNRSSQNQLMEAERMISNLTAENRMLKTIQQRQDIALSKYEFANTELPKLLHSQEEEIRVWETKCRNLSNLHKELTERLDKKEIVFQALSDQNKYYLQLDKTKNLTKRQKLTEELENIQKIIEEKDNNMKQTYTRLQSKIKYINKLLFREQNKIQDYNCKLEKINSKTYNLKELQEILKEQQVQLSNRNLFDYNKEREELTDTDHASFTNLRERKKSSLFLKPKSVRVPVGTNKRVHFQGRIKQQGRLPSGNEMKRLEPPKIIRTISNLNKDDNIEEQPSESTLSVDLYSVKSLGDESLEKVGTSINSSQNEENLYNESIRSPQIPTTDGSVTEEDFEHESEDSQRNVSAYLTKELDDFKQKVDKEREEWTSYVDDYTKEMNIEETSNSQLNDFIPGSKVNQLLASLKK